MVQFCGGACFRAQEIEISLALHRSLSFSQLGHEPCSEDGSDLEQTRRLAAAMGHITILKKGKIDVISNGHEGRSSLASSLQTD